MERTQRVVRLTDKAEARIPTQRGIQKPKRAMDPVRPSLWVAFVCGPVICAILLSCSRRGIFGLHGFCSRNTRWYHIARMPCPVSSSACGSLSTDHVHSQRTIRRSRRPTTDCTGPFLGAARDLAQMILLRYQLRAVWFVDACPF